MMRDLPAHPFYPLFKGCLFFAVMACLPFVLHFLPSQGQYELGVLNDIGLYAVLALSLNIILGHAGLFHMGHAAFYAIGAYTTAILNTLYQVPIMHTLPLAGVAAALCAFLVARPIIHLRGDYLLMVTIGIVEIVRIALDNNILGLTGGANGIYGIARPELFGLRIVSATQFFYLIWGFAAITVALFSLLEHSRFGRALRYIKHDDIAAVGCGVNVARYKLLAFVLGAFWAGMAGTLFAAKMNTIDPTSFTYSESVLLFVMVILGGAGSITGVIVGAFLIIGLPELFREFSSARMLIFGAAMVAMMIFRPQGLVPPKSRRYNASSLVGKFCLGTDKACLLAEAEALVREEAALKAEGGKA